MNMRKILMITLLALLIMTLAFATGAQASPKVGDVIPFGEWEWLVLDVQDNKALIITNDVIEQRPYNVGGGKRVEGVSVTWETCTLREYLNGEFLQKFTPRELGRIEETKILNPKNLWYSSDGENDTIDKVFLLNLEEVDKYFGDSGDYLNKVRKTSNDGKLINAHDGLAFSNSNDSSRIAKFGNEASTWWLRSLGDYSNVHTAAAVTIYGEILGNKSLALSSSLDYQRYAAYVFIDGVVNVRGYTVGHRDGGVRPALWLLL